MCNFLCSRDRIDGGIDPAATCLYVHEMKHLWTFCYDSTKDTFAARKKKATPFNYHCLNQ